MSVSKFRSLGEAGRLRQIQPGTVEFSKSLRAVFLLAARLSPPQNIRPGVYKFRNIEQAQAQRKAWTRA